MKSNLNASGYAHSAAAKSPTSRQRIVNDPASSRALHYFLGRRTANTAPRSPFAALMLPP